MGEAKHKEAVLRAALLVECDLWDKPGTPEEATAVAEIRRLPIERAERAPADELAWGRMPARECHANAIWYSENDPSGQTEHVVGWWLQGDIFMLHSVIRAAGRYICITPQEWDVPSIFPFIPDPKITWIAEGDFRRYVRDEYPIGAGLRADPAAHRVAILLMRERLNAGMKPRRAMELADREACERLGIPS
ncbi:hypothetical protein [Sphingomonas hylomeconis]|uniref:Uncharacterized protein n=1 Tax=Sphingomonas hylomeconis TaxID=1395958 RepID=A0ABV7SQW7_9SPHN|nr:hypothetical protein [Sphingomonas hylomeconis]